MKEDALAEQPYDSGARIELSERSNTISVPPLSRYARASAQKDSAPKPSEQSPPERTRIAVPIGPAETSLEPPSKGGGAPVAAQPVQAAPAPAAEAWAPRPAGPSESSEARPTEVRAALPTVLPPERGHEQRVPFWKRITLPRTQAAPPTPTSIEPVLARLEALEKLLAESQKATIGQLEQMDENLVRLLELEDELALSEVRERLALVEAGQVEIADGLHSVSRNLSVLTVVIALVVAASAFALGVIL